MPTQPLTLAELRKRERELAEREDAWSHTLSPGEEFPEPELRTKLAAVRATIAEKQEEIPIRERPMASYDGVSVGPSTPPEPRTNEFTHVLDPEDFPRER